MGKVKLCPDCDGSGERLYIPPGTEKPQSFPCPRCKRKGYIPLKEEKTPKPSIDDEQRREFYTGENT